MPTRSVNQEAEDSDGEEDYFDAVERVNSQETVNHQETGHVQETALDGDSDEFRPIAAHDFIPSKQDQHVALILEKLPREILLEIMRCLPHGALYLLQQTCQTFRHLSKDQVFKVFNLEFREPGTESYCITKAGHKQRQKIRDILARKSHCDGCCALRESGLLQWKMKMLYQPNYCSGCKQDHPRLFFSPDQPSERYPQCLGRTGSFSLCSHQSIAGPDMVTLVNIGKNDEIMCKHKSHVPPQLSDPGKVNWHRSYFPQAEVRGYQRSGLELDFSKEAELLFLNHKSHISFQKLRADLEGVCRTLFENQQVFCGHLCSQMEELLGCLRSEECQCFPSSGLPSTSESYHQGFSCNAHTFSCRICKAEYNLRRKPTSIVPCGSSVVVQVTGDWSFPSFLSPGWLFNLRYNTDNDCDPRLKRNPLLDESTKHVLWCDSPGCATGSERRWMRMAQTYLHESLVRPSRPHDFRYEDVAEFWDMGWLSLEYDIFHDNDDGIDDQLSLS